MTDHTRIQLADYLQAAEIETHILIQEEDSVRADWWRASCGFHDWYTTGSRPNVEDAAAHHVAWDHTACAAVDPESPADAPLYCRMLPDHGDDHFNGGRTWANDREPAATDNQAGRCHSGCSEGHTYVRGKCEAPLDPGRTVLTDAELDAIRRRNRDLAAIPFETHDGRVHGDNCPPCNLVRGIGDVSKLLEMVDRLNSELGYSAEHTVRAQQYGAQLMNERDKARAQLAELTPAGYEYRAQGAFMHEVTEEHARSYPNGWANDYRLESRPLYAGAWHEPESGERCEIGDGDG